MVTSRDPEKCYYCNNDGEYSQLVGETPEEYAVSWVCKKHLVISLTS